MGLNPNCHSLLPLNFGKSQNLNSDPRTAVQGHLRLIINLSVNYCYKFLTPNWLFNSLLTLQQSPYFGQNRVSMATHWPTWGKGNYWSYSVSSSKSLPNPVQSKQSCPPVGEFLAYLCLWLKDPPFPVNVATGRYFQQLFSVAIAQICRMRGTVLCHTWSEVTALPAASLQQSQQLN